MLCTSLSASASEPVSATHSVALLVRELQFDVGVIEAHLVKLGRCDAPEPVAGHAVLVAHASQRHQDCVVRNRLLVVAFARKQEPA